VAFTFFFRDLHVLELTVKHLVPFVMGRSRIRVWDAGCAMGPEPYSLAIMLAESMGHFSFKNLTIYATDVDEQDTFGETIRAGLYHEDELKRIPEDILKKYFAKNGAAGSLRVIDQLREKVVFRKHDLLTLQAVGGDFSLIMCKNVLLHFQPDERKRVLELFHRSLSPGAYLVTEQTQKMPRELDGLFQQVASDGQIFRKVEVGS
jgi:chemotaxis protein methyltransferase CheR